MVVIRCMGYALNVPCKDEGKYLQAYDPEAFRGRGKVVWTDDINRAATFANPRQAMAMMRASPACHPVRASDGKPNRPLSAFNLLIEPLEE